VVAKARGFEKSFEGTVAAIDSQIDEVTRAVKVRALIPNPEGALKPGLLMTVDLLKNPRKAVVVPESAIIPEGRKHFVFAVDESVTPPVADKRAVMIGARREGDVEIIDGLQAGEKIIVQGTMMARPGGPVAISAVQEKGESLADTLKKLREQKGSDGKPPASAAPPAAKGP
jgi:membrane fusion protein (multidrug efflux system)